jgi:hypothetical protein
VGDVRSLLSAHFAMEIIIVVFPQVNVYGDATGNGRQTAASRTDWQIVKEFFNRYPYKVDLRVPSSNPPVTLVALMLLDGLRSGF